MKQIPRNQRPKTVTFPKFVSDVVAKAITRRKGSTIYYTETERAKKFDLIREVRNKVELLLYDYQAMNVLEAIDSVRNITGDIAEIGTYKGATAHLIEKYLRDNRGNLGRFFVCDTFEGLKDCGENDVSRLDNVTYESDVLENGDFSAGHVEVSRLLGQHEKIILVKGYFPESATPEMKGATFSFVHLDVDTETSTMKSLEFLYPRMATGGIILVDDYLDIKGVRIAVDTFMEGKRIPVIRGTGAHAMIIKG